MTTKAEQTAQLLQCGYAVGDRLEGRSGAPGGPPYYGTVTGVRYRSRCTEWIVAIQWEGCRPVEYHAAYVARRWRRVEAPK